MASAQCTGSYLRSRSLHQSWSPVMLGTAAFDGRVKDTGGGEIHPPERIPPAPVTRFMNPHSRFEESGYLEGS
nr:hypothetical protein CFP56_30785 [Quercus suber]